MRELSREYHLLGLIAKDAGAKIKANAAFKKAMDCLELSIAEEIRVFDEEQSEKRGKK